MADISTCVINVKRCKDKKRFGYERSVERKYFVLKEIMIPLLINHRNMEEELLVSSETRKLMTRHIADFYLKEAHRRMDYSLSVLESSVSRGYILLNILIIVISGLCWVLYNDSFHFIPAVIGLSFFIVACLILLFFVIRKRNEWQPSRTPSKMDIDEFLGYYNHQELEPEKIYVNLICDELQIIDDKVNLNDKISAQRVHYYYMALSISICGCIIEIAGYIISLF